MNLDHLDGPGVLERFAEIEELYAEAFPRSDLDDYRWRTQRHLASAGFEAVTARNTDALVGFVYGLPLPAGTSWWDGLDPAAPAGFTAETGRRTFAVIDMAVQHAYQGQGQGRRLMDELLAGRPEERATLATTPTEYEVQRMYQRWGWRHVGRVPGGERATQPLFALYTIDLRPDTGTSW